MRCIDPRLAQEDVAHVRSQQLDRTPLRRLGRTIDDLPLRKIPCWGGKSNNSYDGYKRENQMPFQY